MRIRFASLAFAFLLTAATPNAVFNHYLLKTLRLSAAPVYLPAWIPPFNGRHPQLHLTVDTARGYSIAIDPVPNCDGADACMFMSLSAKRTHDGDLEPDSRPVRLSNGIVAYYTRIRCGASCGPELLQWRRGRYTYTITIKDAGRAAIVRTANSMVLIGSKG